MKLAQVDPVDVDKSVPYSEFYFHLSGSVERSLGENAYIAHFIKPTSSISEFGIIKKRKDTSPEIKSLIAMFESMRSFPSSRFSKITCDNVRENIPEELKIY